MDRDPFERGHSDAHVRSSESESPAADGHDAQDPFSPPDGIAMRAAARARVEIPIEFTRWDPRHRAFGFVTNVAPGGLFIETAFPAAVGSDLVVIVWRPGWVEELLLACVVRWTRDQGMGLQFASTGPREAAAVRALLDESHTDPTARAMWR